MYKTGETLGEKISEEEKNIDTIAVTTTYRFANNRIAQPASEITQIQIFQKQYRESIGYMVIKLVRM